MDNSDWWSINRGPDSDENVQTQEREFTSSNFQVLGIKLGDTMFRVAAAKLGKATIIERGDASTGRRQVCYASPGNRNKVHLILEQGEVEYTFYLFADGPTWEGADRCVDSGAISTHLATASGVRLGQTPAQVIAILGDPTVKRENELIYSFSVKKKTSAQDLKEARERNPHMSNKDFQETYGSYNLGAGILAKFMDSKLTYLEVSSVESN
ncbi:MAG TPA: hypothetical protein VMJ93_15660 [Verrucomicrobiae bacterium]|nr:hypothetical protein [Verrucomicrobiae bacterium]